MQFPLPGNERGRLEAVRRYGIYGSDPEPGFDDLSEIAAQIASAPISLVNIVGDTEVWLKARRGIPPDLAEVPRGAVCCAHAICQSGLLWVPDTHADARFRDLPFIATEPFVRFYAGMPLIDSGGYALGTLCVMDLAPREPSFEVAEGLRRLAQQVVAQLELRIKLAEVRQAQQALASEKERADALILNILPAEIARELAEKGSVEPRHHPSTTVMFADFVNFTHKAEQLAPRTVIDELHRHFCTFDDIVARHSLEKLKTIGDAYMCAGGLLGARRSHPVDACLAALEIQNGIDVDGRARRRLNLPPWELRIGMHTGNVMSGVVGRNKFTYDVWGDAVNVAARVERAGEAGRINLSQATFQHVERYFEFTPRGTLDVRNRGRMPMFFLDRLKPEFSLDADGRRPNPALSQAVAGTTTGWALH
jgi:adenylate cyclase